MEMELNMNYFPMVYMRLIDTNLFVYIGVHCGPHTFMRSLAVSCYNTLYVRTKMH